MCNSVIFLKALSSLLVFSLQVAMAVDIEHMATANSPTDSSDDEEGLTAEDLEELNTISQASMKFLTVSTCKICVPNKACKFSPVSLFYCTVFLVV